MFSFLFFGCLNYYILGSFFGIKLATFSNSINFFFNWKRSQPKKYHISDSDDEPITLSLHALAALQNLEMKRGRLEKFESLYQQSEDKFDEQKKQEQQKITIDDFKEDWQLSQFWYSDETAKTLGKALLEGADETQWLIASAPSVYAAIKQFPPEEIPTEHIYLLEFDPRFKVLAGSEHFSVYDYNKPNDIPEHLRNKCHRLLIDPPFLEEECQTKSSQAAKNLLVQNKTEKTKYGDNKYKLITSTGERMFELVTKKTTQIPR